MYLSGLLCLWSVVSKLFCAFPENVVLAVMAPFVHVHDLQSYRIVVYSKQEEACSPPRVFFLSGARVGLEGVDFGVWCR